MSETNDKGRRSFLAAVSTGWALFTAASVAGLGMCVRFLFPNDTFEPATKFKVGYPGEFAASSEGVVDKRYKTRGIWMDSSFFRRFVPTWAARRTGWRPRRSSNAHAMEAASIRAGSTSRDQLRGRWRDSRSASPLTGNSRSTREKNTSRKRGSGMTRNRS